MGCLGTTLHCLFVAAYMGLGLYIQLSYIYTPLNIICGGWGLALLIFTCTGSMTPIFVMIFDRMVKHNQFRSVCGKMILFILIAAGCTVQIAFGSYMLATAAYNSYDMALTNMDNAMEQWGMQIGISEDLDFLQNFYKCCGSLTYTDWDNVVQFQDYATHYNATAEHPVTDGCMADYDPNYPLMNLDEGLYYNSTDDLVLTSGCVYDIDAYIYWNVVYILAPIILTVSVTEFMFLLKGLFCTRPVRTDYLLK